MLLRNYVSPKRLLVSLLILLPICGCAVAPVEQQANYPVAWTAEYQMPDKFPVEMAFQTSTSEAEKNANNNSAQHWASINHNLQFASLSKDSVKFFDDSGSQTISLLGSGDFNADGVEDIIISSRDSVTGGSYFNIRLFALTVDTDGRWVLIEALSP